MKGSRFLLVLYDLVFIFLAGAAVAAACGRPEPLYYINLVLSAPRNRIMLAAGAGVLILFSLWILIALMRGGKKKLEKVTVDNGLSGQVAITVPAITAIIMMAVKKVNGVKDVKSKINESLEGLVVDLHIMVNPELKVPEMSKDIQNVVKEHLEEIGGLKVAQIKVLVDDFAVTNRSVRT